MSGISEGAPVAERLYYHSPETSFRARVTDVRLAANERDADGSKTQIWQVALDRTAFYPESGGQPWDTGVLIATARSGAVLEVPVERVEEDAAGEVWHTVRKPLVQGTEVEGRVDAERRLDHKQQHSGQHLLSAVFLDELGAATVSFHLGAENSTIDLKMPEGAALTDEAAGRVERKTNELIAADRIMRSTWRAREEAEAMLARGVLRKLPDREGPLRVVEIEGVEWNACGGTHTRSTAGIGVVLLRGLEKVKAGWRVSFVCGLRAAQRAQQDYAMLYAASQQLTVGLDQVSGRIGLLQSKDKAAAKEKAQLLDELAAAQAAELLRSAPDGATVHATFQDKPAEYGRRVASKVAAGNRAALIATVQGNEASLQIHLRKDSAQHAGTLVRAVAEAREVRGGGGAQTAQLVCAPALMAEVMQLLDTQIT